MDRGKRGSGSTVVWKYIFAGCIIIYTALVFVYMSGSNRPFTEQARELENAIEKRIEERKNVFDGYAPEQVKMLKEAQKSVRGTYVFLAISPDSNRYREAFTKAL